MIGGFARTDRVARLAPALVAAAAVLLVGGAEASAEDAPDFSCLTDADCPTEMVCVQHACYEPDELPESSLYHTTADEACGQDRRCRLERLASRNRMRRHYRAAHHERIVYEEAQQIVEQQREEVLRQENPWSAALYRHPFGFGLYGGRTFSEHFRAEVTLVFQDERVDYSDGGQDHGFGGGSHEVTFTTMHASYFPSRAWFSPVVSVGFGFGGGDFGGGSNPGVRYHFVTGAVGAEAQFEFGFKLRLAYRYGRLLYNQAYHGPGDYDDSVRQRMREFMHEEGLVGFDFSIGWAF